MFSIPRKRIFIILTGLFSLILVFLIMGFGLFFVRPAEKGGSDQVIIVREGMSLSYSQQNFGSRYMVGIL